MTDTAHASAVYCTAGTTGNCPNINTVIKHLDYLIAFLNAAKFCRFASRVHLRQHAAITTTVTAAQRLINLSGSIFQRHGRTAPYTALKTTSTKQASCWIWNNHSCSYRLTTGPADIVIASVQNDDDDDDLNNFCKRSQKITD